MTESRGERMTESRPFTAQPSTVLKRTLTNGIRLYRSGGWGGNGFGMWSEWDAVDENGEVVAHWSSDYRGVFVMDSRFNYRFREWARKVERSR